MKLLQSVLLCIATIAAAPAFAAQIKLAPATKNASLRNLAIALQPLAKKSSVYGDQTRAATYDYSSVATEPAINTVKQLNFMKAFLNSDDSGADLMQNKSPAALVAHLLDLVDGYVPDESEAEYAQIKANLLRALTAVKADSKLKIFGTNHADEDGSWQILDVLDTENHQILLLKVGFKGT